MAAVQHEVVQVGTRTLVRLSGELAVSTAPAVRTALIKCLVEQPDALVVDVASLTVAEPAVLSVFLVVARQASVWPGTPLLICAPDPGLAAVLSGGGYGRLRVYPSVGKALAAPRERRLTSVTDMLLPVSGASRRARVVASEACTQWELPHLVDPAALVAGELVTNAVVHAGTMVELRLALGGRYLMIAVRDGCTEVPRLVSAPSTDPAAGRGLMLVGATARRWGSLPAGDGKVVWASLPIAARRPT